MNNKDQFRKVCSGLCGLALFGSMAVASQTPVTNPLSPSTRQQDTGQAQSVTGTISSIGRNSFTLALGPRLPGQQFQRNEPRTMTFLVDQNTTVDGQLKVGANADVTYRQDNGNNVAIAVRVS